MNNYESRYISLMNFLLVITVVPLLCKLFMMGWRRSKVATLAFIFFAGPALSSLSAVVEPINYSVSCHLRPNQEACIHWKKTGIME
jgi:EamA domain-containing membrane protein RarD